MDFGKHSKFKINDVLKTVFLSLSLIFFFQCFYYIKDVYSIYIFNKIFFGIFCLALSCFYFLKSIQKNKARKIDYWLLFIFLYLVISSIITTNWIFGQPIFDGLMGQAKLTGIFYYFAIMVFLSALRIDIKKMTNSILILGAISITVFFVLSFLLKNNFILGESTLFVKHSQVKGFYFKFPLKIFVELSLYFYLISAILDKKKRIQNICFSLIILFILSFYFKQRLSMFYTYIGCFLILFKYSSRKIKIFIIFLFVSMVVFYSLMFFSEHSYFSYKSNTMGVRFNTLSIIFNEIGNNPMRILFGYGNLSYSWTTTWHTLFGKTFFISDVGLIGIIFEFGIIGTLIIYLTMLYFWKISNFTNKKSPIMLQAINIYILVLLVTIPVSAGGLYILGMPVSLFGILQYFKFKELGSI